MTFLVKASGVIGPGAYNYLMTARSTEGFVPHLLEPQNMDHRNLGVQLRFPSPWHVGAAADPDALLELDETAACRNSRVRGAGIRINRRR